jgi:hypothetical protein
MTDQESDQESDTNERIVEKRMSSLDSKEIRRGSYSIYTSNIIFLT